MVGWPLAVPLFPRIVGEVAAAAGLRGSCASAGAAACQIGRSAAVTVLGKVYVRYRTHVTGYASLQHAELGQSLRVRKGAAVE